MVRVIVDLESYQRLRDHNLCQADHEIEVHPLKVLEPLEVGDTVRIHAKGQLDSGQLRRVVSSTRISHGRRLVRLVKRPPKSVLRDVLGLSYRNRGAHRGLRTPGGRLSEFGRRIEQVIRARPEWPGWT